MILLLSVALANEDGKPGAAVSGCTCHGDPVRETTLEIMPDTFEVPLGGVVNFDIVVRNATKVVAGITVDSPVGTFAEGENTVLDRDDIVHPEPIPLVDGAATFRFSWTAPNEDVTVPIYSAANAGDDDGKDSGDEWNWGDDIEIIVGEGGLLDTGEAEADTSGCGGCSGVPAGPAPWMAATPAFLLALRRREPGGHGGPPLR